MSAKRGLPTAQHSTAQHSTAQHSTAQHSTAQHSTAQHSTAQHKLYPEGVPNWANKTIFTGDNLAIMRRMNSASVDLIYLDPPFNSNANYAAPIGSKAAGAEFKDTWTLTDIDMEWLDLTEAKHPRLNRVIHAAMSDSDMSYMIYMAVRIIEMRRILKDTGSVYLHCNEVMSHYLKLMMDALFGRKQFRNEIVWFKGYRGTPRRRRWQQEHDTLLFYSKSDSYSWNTPIGNYKDKSMGRYNKVDESGNRYALIKRKRSDGSIYYGKTYPKGKPAGDVIDVPILASTDKERTRYPTQKPLKLLDWIIEASSNEGDMVFDPFCGCATTCVSAEGLGRQWIGIDISQKAAELVKLRTKDVLGTLLGDIVHRTDIPQRTDMGKLPKYNNLENKAKLYGDQGGFCNGCSTHFKKVNLTIDHIIAKSKGGTDHIDNLQLLCGHCNSVKGNRDMNDLRQKMSQKPIVRLI